jgi:hypothetical protein
MSDDIVRGQGCHSGREVGRGERDLGATMSIVGDSEVRPFWRDQRESVRDGAAKNRQLISESIVACLGVVMKMEAAQVEGVMLAEEVNRVAEEVAGQCGVCDIKRCLAVEGDRADAGGAEAGNSSVPALRMVPPE